MSVCVCGNETSRQGRSIVLHIGNSTASHRLAIRLQRYLSEAADLHFSLFTIDKKQWAVAAPASTPSAEGNTVVPPLRNNIAPPPKWPHETVRSRAVFPLPRTVYHVPCLLPLFDFRGLTCLDRDLLWRRYRLNRMLPIGNGMSVCRDCLVIPMIMIKAMAKVNECTV